MKIKLIFCDWQDEEFNSLYNTMADNRLSMTAFYSGTTFDGEIKLNIEQESKLKKHIRLGYRPVVDDENLITDCVVRFLS